ncbi:MAG: hypothetical protein FWG53_07720 [Clostridiales bacterium]|nr:hypothetical protein [Clostridiales bacterium]
MIVRNVWHTPHLPEHFIAELETGELKMFLVVPYREIKEEDLLDYADFHPRRRRGQLLTPSLYHFYGLEKSAENYSEVLKIRVTPSQKEKLEAAGRTSDLIRKYIDESL